MQWVGDVRKDCHRWSETDETSSFRYKGEGRSRRNSLVLLPPSCRDSDDQSQWSEKSFRVTWLQKSTLTY